MRAEVIHLQLEAESRRRAHREAETLVCRVQDSGRRVVDDHLTSFLTDSSGERWKRPSLSTPFIPHTLVQPPLVGQTRPVNPSSVNDPSPYQKSALELDELLDLVNQYDLLSQPIF